MVRALPLLLLLICSGNATELLRDKHPDTTYVFKSMARFLFCYFAMNKPWVFCLNRERTEF